MTDAISNALQIVCLSDIGLISDNNEDNVLAVPEIGLVVLADGMGGHNAGEVASAMTTASIGQGVAARLASANDAQAVLDLLQQEINQANQAVYKRAQTEAACEGMGTTVVACLFHDNMVTIGHLGDSRLYRLRDDVLQCITRDHSILQEQIDAGILTKEQARLSPQKNLITRALGVELDESAEMQQIPVQIGDVFLLCSDGLNDMVEDEDIEMTLSMLHVNLPLCATHLIQAANDGGGRDNVSVILVRVLADFAQSAAGTV